jgi:hypothetical protein
VGSTPLSTLRYNEEGEGLAAHVDLPCRLYTGEGWDAGVGTDETTLSTHTWILYLRDCDGHADICLLATFLPLANIIEYRFFAFFLFLTGGHTELLAEDESVSAQVQPKRGKFTNLSPLILMSV